MKTADEARKILIETLEASIDKEFLASLDALVTNVSKLGENSILISEGTMNILTVQSLTGCNSVKYLRLKGYEVTKTSNKEMKISW